MKFKGCLIKSIFMCLGAFGGLALWTSGASAATPLPISEQADKASVYYVGTRYYKIYFGWVVAKVPLALTIQVDPMSSNIHETLVGGVMTENGDIQIQKVSKTFIPIAGNSNQFKIQFEGIEGSGTLQTSSHATLSASTTAQEFLQDLEWHWNFEVGEKLNQVEGRGRFETGRLHISGTIRSHAGRYLIDYRDEYKEVSFDEFSNMRLTIISDKAH